MKKVALVTGGGGVLGKATVEKFLKEGYTVVATVTPGKMPKQKNADLLYDEVDLRDESSTTQFIERIVQQFKRIDVAVCTVGGFEAGDIHQADAASLERMSSLNFKTAYHTARPAFEQMKKQSEGRIVFIGSRPALEPARGKHVVSYALSKSLLFTLADILNADAGSKNIRCHVVAPGTIDTPDNRAAMPEANFKEWISAEALAELIYSTTNKSEADVVIRAY